MGMNGRYLTPTARRRRHIVAAIEGWLGTFLSVGSILAALAIVELGCRLLGSV